MYLVYPVSKLLLRLECLRALEAPKASILNYIQYLKILKLYNVLSLKIRSLFCNKLFCIADNFCARYSDTTHSNLGYLIKLNASPYLYTSCEFGKQIRQCLSFLSKTTTLIRVFNRSESPRPQHQKRAVAV